MKEEKKVQVYFVATPIGNLAEFSFRAVEVLRNADLILCEDTRHSVKLLNHYDIVKPLKSYHKFNEKERLSFIEEQVLDNKTLAIISDGGMPCISDPGSILVNFLIKKDISYTVVSGASAFVNAFVLSGFSAPFTFVGFLPVKNTHRQTLLDNLGQKTCLIFYSSVHDVNDDLAFLATKLGKRKVAVVREISKLYEDIIFGILGEINLQNPKGEYVLVVDKGENENNLNDLEIKEHLQFYMDKGIEKMEAIKQVAKDRGVGKSTIYKALHE